MALGIYAGNSISSMTLLPSPVSIKPSNEIIWSENTGRAQSGSNKAKMIGDVIDEKLTYAIQWGYLTAAEFGLIKSLLKPGFFYFGIGSSAAEAQSTAAKYYRSNIAADIVTVGNETWYKDAEVSVIEQ